jgi:hypothetical protein
MITIPTISQLYTSIKADLEAEFADTIPLFGKNFLRALAIVQAGKLKLYYLAIAGLQKNIFVDTADPEISGGTLERFGRIKLGRNPFPATSAQYTVSVSGSIGATIPASTTFKSNDDSLSPGKLFMLDNDFVFAALIEDITLRALEPGLQSKLSIGDELTATAPIANVDKTGTVTVETIIPLAAEDIEAYRSKALEAYRLEPNGGAGTDYRLWAADAQGVQQTYPYAISGTPNEVNLYVEATIADSTDGKGTPSGALLTAVEAVIELDPDTTKPLLERGRRPLGIHQVHYLPVVIKNIDIIVNASIGLSVDDQTAITDAIAAELSNIRPFVASADVLENKNDIIDVNKVINIILNTRPGSVFGTITLKVNTVVMTTYTFTDGNIPYLNSVTFP